MRILVNNKITYEPRPTQEKFHLSRAKYRAYVGGLGSGKTVCGSLEMIKWTQEFPGGLFLVGRLTATALRDTTQKRFFEWIDRLTDGHRDRLVHKWLEGQSHLWLKTPVPGVYSEVLFRHLDEPGPLGSLDLDGWWVDECHEPEGDEVPEEVFLMLRGRLRGVVGPLRGIITSNSGGKDWIWKWFFSKQKEPDHDGFVASSEENRMNLPPGYIDELRRTHPEAWVRRFLDASFEVFAGKIFDQFSPDDVVFDLADVVFPRRASAEAGFDFGVSAPTGIVIARCMKDHVYVIDEYYKPEADITKTAEWLKQRGILAMWSDPTVVNRAAGRKSPQELYYEEGISLIPAPTNDALARISIIHKYLFAGKLHIERECEVLLNTLADSKWANVKAGQAEKPEKKRDHLRDALAYMLLGRPTSDLFDPVEPGKRREPRDPEIHPSFYEDEDRRDKDFWVEEDYERYVPQL